MCLCLIAGNVIRRLLGSGKPGRRPVERQLRVAFHRTGENYILRKKSMN